MNSIFITGTNTGVGKTLITAGLTKCLRSKKIKAIFFKPIATGCEKINGKLISTDIIFLSKNLNLKKNDISQTILNPIRYEFAVSPYTAAKITQQNIKLAEIKKSFNYLKKIYDFVVVEGIGGIYVPLNQKMFVCDMIKTLNIPVVIVAENKLGILNDVLLTVNLCQQRSIILKGIILNNCNFNKDYARKYNKKDIEKLTKVPVLLEIPYFKKINQQNVFKKFVSFFLKNFLWENLW